jgi:hypothetical protein
MSSELRNAWKEAFVAETAIFSLIFLEGQKFFGKLKRGYRAFGQRFELKLS